MLHRNLGELLSESASRYPARTAIVFGSKKISYRSLDEATDRIAAGLLHLGIRKQDKVALFLDNCPEFVLAYYAVLKAGAVVVPVNYMFKEEEAKYILEDSEAACLIVSRTSLDMARELRLRLDSLKYLISASCGSKDTPDLGRIKKENTSVLHAVRPQPHELAVILYTSGTTGHPKGAMLSHYNLVSNAADSSSAIQVTPRDSVICVLPLFHSFAATVCMNLPLSAGARMIIMKSVRPFKRVIRSIRRNRVSVFVGVPSLYTILAQLKLPKAFRSPLIKLFNPVRLCISGAAALPAGTFRAFERKFRIPLLEGYGLTEASPVVTLNPHRGKRKAGSIGKALSANIELRIVDERNNPLSWGHPGELLVRGPNVMQGYYKQPEASAEILKGGWLYTGDIAQSDRDGYFFIMGRKKEMINVRGLNVYPREIEEVLYQNPKIKEAAVVGIADAHRGEVPKGFIVLKDGEQAGEHEIIQYLKERLAPYKIPKHIEFRASLPKNTTGKVLKRLLA